MKTAIKLFFLLYTICFFCQGSREMSEEEFLFLQSKTRAFFYSNIDSSFFYIAKIEKSTNKIHLAFAKGAKGYSFALNGDLNNAIKNYNDAINLIKEVPRSKSKIQNESFIYNFGGNIYYSKLEFDKALECYFRAKDLSKINNDIVSINMINQNIAAIKSDIGNFKEAISGFIESNYILDANKDKFKFEKYLHEKAKVNLNLGIAYEKRFSKDRNNDKFIDSAFYYYKKTLSYSQNDMKFKVVAFKNIGNICYYRGQLDLAEKNYLSVLSLSKETENLYSLYSSVYNLGIVNYDKKKYDNALIFFNKVDSLYTLYPNLGINEFVGSNYRQAKIYSLNNDSENSLKHSIVYINNYSKMSSIQNENILEANTILNYIKINEEVTLIKKTSERHILIKQIVYIFSILIVIFLLFVIIRKTINKKQLENRIEMIIQDFDKMKLEIENGKNNKVIKSESVSLNSNNEKIILDSLKILIAKKMYLKSDFTQQVVAKKIKTNTTYLSYIVNKHYKKSFSNYLNELRINYVIEEIMSNSKYREYTTQAIAESAGFKNADSFTTSFKKKTGVTPFQFINEIKKRME